MLVNFMAIWSIYALLFGIFYVHLVYFVVILVYFSRFGILLQEKSGNSEREVENKRGRGIKAGLSEMQNSIV
jgi:hypothetical protein